MLPIYLWDVATGHLKAVLRNDNGQANSRVEFTASGTILTGDAISTIRLWDSSSGQLRCEIDGYSGYFLKGMVFSPTGQLLVADSDVYTTTVRAWNVKTGQRKLLVSLLSSDLVFSLDGSVFAAYGIDHNIRLWHTISYQTPIVLTGHTDLITSLAFSPDNATLASGSNDGTVRLWTYSIIA